MAGHLAELENGVWHDAINHYNTANQNSFTLFGAFSNSQHAAAEDR